MPETLAVAGTGMVANRGQHSRDEDGPRVEFSARVEVGARGADDAKDPQRYVEARGGGQEQQVVRGTVRSGVPWVVMRFGACPDQVGLGGMGQGHGSMGWGHGLGARGGGTGMRRARTREERAPVAVRGLWQLPSQPRPVPVGRAQAIRTACNPTQQHRAPPLRRWMGSSPDAKKTQSCLIWGYFVSRGIVRLLLVP